MSAIPENAPEPQDHKPKKSKAKARQAEATEKSVTIEQNGVTLVIPIGKYLPLKARIAFTNGDEFGGTRYMLGDEQWEEFLATDPTSGDYEEMAEKLKDASGN